MSNKTLFDYCENPSDFANLTDEQKKKFDEICKSIEKGKGEKRGWNVLKNLSISTAQLIPEMIAGIFTPEGMKMLGIFMGVELGGNIALNFMYRGIAKSIGPQVMQTAAELAAKENALIINNAILSSTLAKATEKTLISKAAFNLTRYIAQSLSKAVGIAMQIQFVGAVLDAWDPSGYNKVMNAKTINDFNKTYNQVFMNKFLQNNVIGFDANGNPVYDLSWPVQFYVDNIISSKKEDYYSDKVLLYSLEYLNNLEFNSNGEKIDRSLDKKLITVNDFRNALNPYAQMFANQNTVVAGWLEKYWPILFVILLIVLIILFKISK